MYFLILVLFYHKDRIRWVQQNILYWNLIFTLLKNIGFTSQGFRWLNYINLSNTYWVYLFLLFFLANAMVFWVHTVIFKGIWWYFEQIQWYFVQIQWYFGQKQEYFGQTQWYFKHIWWYLREIFWYFWKIRWYLYGCEIANTIFPKKWKLKSFF